MGAQFPDVCEGEATSLDRTAGNARTARVGGAVTFESRSKDISEPRFQFLVHRAGIGYVEPVAPLDVDQGRCAEKGLPRNAV
jgi:hypothetical protein